MAVRACHFTLSSITGDHGPEKLSRKSFAVKLSSWRVDNFLSDSCKSRFEVRERATCGAELDCRRVSKRPELFCCRRSYGDRGRTLWWGRIRAKSLGLGRRSAMDSLSGRSASNCTHGLSSTDEFGNPIRRRIATARRRKMQLQLRAAVDDPYETLGVPRSATEKEIKQAYRRLALKFHPDVNKEADAQQKFLQIKAAYQTLVDAKSRAKYDSSSRASPQWDPFTWETERPFSKQPEEEEEFYGLEDFFRDLQVDTRKKEKQDAKPKSLWEELAEIGEEFVEFLEKELNITDSPDGDKSSKYRSANDSWDSKKNRSHESNIPEMETEKKKVESEIQEIEEMLAKIKKELGI